MYRRVVSHGLSMAILLLMIWLCSTPIANGQITFSRDWSPGKRSSSTEGNCLQGAKSIAALCHMLMNELKQLSACESRLMVEFLQGRSDEASSDEALYAEGRR